MHVMFSSPFEMIENLKMQWNTTLIFYSYIVRSMIFLPFSVSVGAHYTQRILNYVLP